MARIHRHQPTENGDNGHAKHSEGNVTTVKKKDNSNSNSNSQFLERVSSIPLVKDGVFTAQALANKIYLGRFALSKANATYNTVTRYATNSPYYASYVQPQLEKVDNLGCKSLDIIQEKVPIINQPTTDIYQNVVAKPIDGVKSKLDSTLSSVTHPAHVVIQETNKRLGVVVDNLEGAVDKYLPASSESNVTVVTDNNSNQVVRVYGVFNEASRRITQRVTEVIPKSRGDLSRLAESNSTIQNLFENICLFQEALAHSITVYGNAAQEKLPTSVTVRVHQATELFAQLTQSISTQLNQLVSFVSAKANQVPDWLKQKVNFVVEATQKQLESIQQEWKRTDINYVDKFKRVSGHLQDRTLPLLEQISSQLASYAQVVRNKAPLQYFGLNQNFKTQ